MERSGPLCPRDPEAPEHQAQVAVLNRFYEAAPKDADGEFMPPAVGDAYRAAAYPDRHGMRLYRTTAYPDQTERGRGVAAVVAWFLQCPVCHFVLPATEVRR
jgi:hypothetical protein